MIMQMQARRPIGQILTDGGFLSQAQLEQALEEQRRSSELLGQVLVRMGILEEGEIRVALSVQEHLGSLDEAIRLGAGVRQMLGSLLVDAGRLSPQELEYALAEQKRQGGKLGDVCVRLGLLSEPQLAGLLGFQQYQGGTGQQPSPLRLGELLVTAGYLSREHLEAALRRQAVSRKKLGEVLIEEGYADPSEITNGVRMQHLLKTSVLVAVLALATATFTGCGSPGGTTAQAPAGVSGQPVASAPLLVESGAHNYFTMLSDNYPMIRPNFYYSTNNASFWSIQALIARSATDVDALGVFRIDVPKTGATMPALNKTFSIEDGTPYERFPGEFVVCNGQKSSNKKVERGTISFSPDSLATGTVTGTFDVTLTDHDSITLPAPQYRLTGSFKFAMGSYGPATPAG